MNVIKIIKSTVANGTAVSVGEVLRVTPQEASLLIGYGKAIIHAATHHDEPAQIETRPVAVQSRKPVMRGRKG